MTKLMLFYGALAVLATVPWYFVFNGVYKDGVFGRCSLGVMSLSAGAILLDAEDGNYDPSNPVVALSVAWAVFLVWHLARFHYRVERRIKAYCPPDCPQDRRSSKVPDRRFFA